jgi:hypothetical protein
MIAKRINQSSSDNLSLTPRFSGADDWTGAQTNCFNPDFAFNF